MFNLIRDIGLAHRNLLRNKGRSFVAIMTVASGVIAFLLAGGFIAWIFQDMREATIRSQLGHVQIVRPGFFEKGVADPYGYLLPDDTVQLKETGTQPNVASITPRLIFSGLISLREATIAFSGEGVDPANEQSISSRIRMLSGQALTSVDERKILLGEGLAKNLGAKSDDTVVLLTKATNGSASAVELTVAGTFATVAKEYDDYAIRVPIPVARKLMRVQGATSWVVLLNSNEFTNDFVEAMRSRLPVDQYEVVPWTSLADFYNKTVVLFSKQVNVMKIIIGLIIILTITNTLTMSVLERTTEIGTSLAVGQCSKSIMRLFIIEGTLIGILGGAIGICLGALLAAGISMIGIPMPPPPGMSHGYLGQVLITRELVLDAGLLAFVTTLLASIFPAWQAGRMNIVDALRYGQ